MGMWSEAAALPERPLFERIASVDRVIEATGAQIEYGGSRACYNRLTDRISIPDERAFFGTDTSTRNHWSAKHGLRRFWWTWLFVQTNGLAVSL